MQTTAGFPHVELPNGFSARELATEDDKTDAQGALRSQRPALWMNHPNMGIFDADGAITAVVAVTHSERRVLGIMSRNFDPLAQPALEAAETYLLALDYRIDGPAKVAIHSRVMGADGRFHDLGNLPDDLHVRGDLVFYASNGPIRLPRRRLRVDGNLILRDCDVESFPSDFLHVTGSADLWGTRIRSVPDGTHVGDRFVPSRDTERLPPGLFVGRDLSIFGSAISSIPEGTLCGQVSLSDRQIPSLPSSFGKATRIHVYSAESRGWILMTADDYRQRTSAT